MGSVAGGKQRHIGCFRTAEKAAEAYAKEYLQLYGTAPKVGNAVRVMAESTLKHAGAAGCDDTGPFSETMLQRPSQNATGYKGVTRQGGRYVAQMYTGESQPGRIYLHVPRCYGHVAYMGMVSCNVW